MRSAIAGLLVKRESRSGERLVTMCCEFCLFIALLFPHAGMAAKHALVIGNSNYQHAGYLENPGNDASDVAAKLRQLGFQVTLEQDNSQQQLLSAVAGFKRQAANADVALLYYAGHATQFDDNNYLLPVDANPDSEESLADQSVSLQSVVKEIESLATTRILILDACRDNPFSVTTRSSVTTRGLRRQKTDNGTLLVFATKPGDVAEDGNGRNSPFTTALLKHIDQPIEVSAMLREVRADVLSATNNRQQPWDNSSLTQAFYFAPETQTSVARTALPIMTAIPAGCFQSGSDEETPGRKAAQESRRRICVAEAFSIASTEITVGQFRAFIEATGYVTDAEKNAGGEEGCFSMYNGDWQWVSHLNWRNYSVDITDNHPVACVSWNDANRYTQWLSKSTGRNIQLPTEAQWSYAARGGSESTWHWGESIDDICQYANVADSALDGHYPVSDHHQCSDGAERAAPVSSYAPNQFGLFDIVGNLWEWTCSAWSENFNGTQSSCDENSNAMRSMRGGGWYSSLYGARSASRDRDYRYNRYAITGFRVVENN